MDFIASIQVFLQASLGTQFSGLYLIRNGNCFNLTLMTALISYVLQTTQLKRSHQICKVLTLLLVFGMVENHFWWYVTEAYQGVWGDKTTPLEGFVTARLPCRILYIQQKGTRLGSSFFMRCKLFLSHINSVISIFCRIWFKTVSIASPKKHEKKRWETWRRWAEEIAKIG